MKVFGFSLKCIHNAYQRNKTQVWICAYIHINGNNMHFLTVFWIHHAKIRDEFMHISGTCYGRKCNDCAHWDSQLLWLYIGYIYSGGNYDKSVIIMHLLSLKNRRFITPFNVMNFLDYKATEDVQRTENMNIFSVIVRSSVRMWITLHS